MFYKLIVLVAIIFLIIAFYKRLNKTLPEKTTRHSATTPLNYQKNNSLFTPQEQHFLITLEEAIASLPVRLYTKISLSNLIKVRKDSPIHDQQIERKHFDFILVHPHSFSPLLVIELSDQHDPTIDEVMAQIALPILYIPPATKYSSTLLNSMIINTLKSA